jgi:hypothetical protein
MACRDGDPAQTNFSDYFCSSVIRLLSIKGEISIVTEAVPSRILQEACLESFHKCASTFKSNLVQINKNVLNREYNE